jgi:hypothetical protein
VPGSSPQCQLWDFVLRPIRLRQERQKFHESFPFAAPQLARRENAFPTARAVGYFLFAVPRLKMIALICFALKEAAAPFQKIVAIG